MSSSIKLRVPEQARGALYIISSLSEDEYTNLYQAFKGTPPTFLAQDFIHAVSKRSKIDFDKVSEIAELLTSLFAVRDEFLPSPSEFPEVFERTIRDMSDEELDLSDDDRTRTVQRVVELFDNESSIGIVAKARALYQDQDKFLLRASIATDMRPIFSTSDDDPSAVVVFHRLKLSYVENGQPKDFYVTIDSFDATSLCYLLDRAVENAQKLRNTLRPSSITVLEGNQDEQNSN